MILACFFIFLIMLVASQHICPAGNGNDGAGVIAAARGGGFGFSTGPHDFTQDMAVDSEKNLYIVGTFEQVATFGNITLTSAGATDIFVVKYSKTGNVVWALRAGNDNYDYANGIHIDSKDNIFITGSFAKTIAFNDVKLTAVTYSEGFLFKLASNGTAMWGIRIGGNNAGGVSNSVAVDSSSIVLTGKITYAASTTAPNITVTGSINSKTFFPSCLPGYKTFVAKINLTGDVIFFKCFVATEGKKIRTTANGTIIVIGNFQTSAVFESVVITPPASSALWNSFVLQLGASGNVMWVNAYYGIFDVFGTNIVVDSAENIIATGFFKGTVLFGSFSKTSVGQSDIYILKLSPTGTVVWVKTGGSVNDDSGHAVAVDNTNAIYVSGYTSGICKFDTVTLMAGKQDMVLLKLDTTGKVAWGKLLPSSNSTFSSVTPAALYVDANFTIYTAGSFLSFINIDNIKLTSVGGYDTFWATFTQSCSACTLGSYSTIQDTLFCTQCPSGTYSNETGATFCRTCAPNLVSNVGATNCFPLPSASPVKPTTSSIKPTTSVTPSVSVKPTTSRISPNTSMKPTKSVTPLTSANTKNSTKTQVNEAPCANTAYGWIPIVFVMLIMELF